MNNLELMDKKFIKVRIKEQWGMDQFLEHFDCTEEEFLIRLKQLYTTGGAEREYGKIVKDIEKNSKVKKSSGSSKWKDYESPLQIAEKKIHEISTLVLPKDLDTLTSTHVALMGYLNTVESQKQAVMIKRQDLAQAIKDLESEEKKLTKALSDKQAELKEVRQQFIDTREENDYLSDLCKEGNACVSRMLDQIYELTKPILYVYENGNIEVEKRGSSMEPDESGAEEIASLMLGRYDDYRGRDIKIVARIIAILRNYKEDVTLIIDGKELEELYNIAIKELAE